MIELDQDHEIDNQHIPVASIKVVGVGGAGGNTINCMVESDYKGVEFIAVNTDAQALKLSKADVTIQIGQKSTKGLGAGANPEVGKRSAEEDLDKVLNQVQDADIVFLTAGMGGGTGSGALPVITQALKEKGILTIVVLTKPFQFEGKRRAQIAEQAVERVKETADTLLIVPNQKLLDVVDEKVSMIDGFGMINEVLNQSVKGVSDIITRAGHINVDFADVREIMRDQGLAVMGTGRAQGQDRARKAALAAISSPLLENMDIAGAQGVLLNISGNSALGLHEISAAASVIYEQADSQANIILGSVIDDTLEEEVVVTVIATGFNDAPKEKHVKPEATNVYTSSFQQEKNQIQENSVQKYSEKPAEKTLSVNNNYSQQSELKNSNNQNIPQETDKLAVVDMKKVPPAQETVTQEVSQKNYQQSAPNNNQSGLQKEQHIQNNSHHLKSNIEQQEHSSGLGSNVIQLKDVDTPTFMRKQNNHNNHFYGKKHKKNKHKWHQQQQQQKYQSQED